MDHFYRLGMRRTGGGQVVSAITANPTAHHLRRFFFTSRLVLKTSQQPLPLPHTLPLRRNSAFTDMVRRMPVIRRGVPCGGPAVAPLRCAATPIPLVALTSTVVEQQNILSATPSSSSSTVSKSLDGTVLIRQAGKAAVSANEWIRRSGGSNKNIDAPSDRSGGEQQRQQQFQPNLPTAHTGRDAPNDPLNKWLYYDPTCGVVVERWPKSALHFLVFPRNVKMQSLNDIKGAQGLALLEDMRRVALDCVLGSLLLATRPSSDFAACDGHSHHNAQMDQDQGDHHHLTPTSLPAAPVVYNPDTHLYHRCHTTTPATAAADVKPSTSSARSRPSLWKDAFPQGTFILGNAAKTLNSSSKASRRRRKRKAQEREQLLASSPAGGCHSHGIGGVPEARATIEILPPQPQSQNSDSEDSRGGRQQEQQQQTQQQGALLRPVITEFVPSPEHYLLQHFFIGFEALPTYPMLKLEILSADLCGPCMVHRVQYERQASKRSFLSLDAVIADVKRHGYVTLNQKAPRTEYAISSGGSQLPPVDSSTATTAAFPSSPPSHHQPTTDDNGVYDEPATTTHRVMCRYCSREQLSVRHMKIHMLECAEAARTLSTSV